MYSDFEINNTILLLTKLFKGLGTFIGYDIKWNRLHINYIYKIASITPFRRKVLKLVIYTFLRNYICYIFVLN